MKFFESLGEGARRAAKYVADKNHQSAMVNRIRVVIKNERENTARAYVALGKYYADNLRDPQNEETERLCRAADDSTARMRRAFDMLDEMTAPDSDNEEDYYDECSGCTDDCTNCHAAMDCDDFEGGEDVPAQKADCAEEEESPLEPFTNLLHEEAAAVQETEEAADDEV